MFITTELNTAAKIFYQPKISVSVPAREPVNANHVANYLFGELLVNTDTEFSDWYSESFCFYQEVINE